MAVEDDGIATKYVLVNRCGPLIIPQRLRLRVIQIHANFATYA